MIRNKALAQDDGAPGGGTTVSGQPPADDVPGSIITQHPSPITQLAPTGGGVTPPAAPGAAQRPAAPAASGQASPSAQVYTEAELNSRLAQQRAQYEKQIERMQLRVEAIATGVPGADVLLDRIDRKAITYDEATRKPNNLKELLEAQRAALAQALGLPLAGDGSWVIGVGEKAPTPNTQHPTPVQAPAIQPTNGAQPVQAISLTKEAIEAMTPAQINANWPAIQAALKAGLIK
jgi:hypothetical protein